MVVRDPKTGEAVLWRYDHMKGKDEPVMYTCGNYQHVDEDTDQQDPPHQTLQEKIDNTEMVECPECVNGYKQGGLVKCKKCYGSGKIAKSLAERIE